MGFSKEITGVFIELNGQQKINIKNLSKKDYEDFLDVMSHLKHMFISLNYGDNTIKNGENKNNSPIGTDSTGPLWDGTPPDNRS